MARRGSGRRGSLAAIDGSAWSEDVWATPGGWEAAVKSPNTITIWQSADGLAWASAAVVAKGDVGVGAHVSASDGTRLLVLYDNAAETSRLVMSKDGRDWGEIDGPPPTHGGKSLGSWRRTSGPSRGPS